MNAEGTPQIEMPRYRSHKTVWALKIATVVSCGTDTTTDENPIVELHFEDQNYAPRRINLCGKPTPEAGWYMVQYKEGYISFSPAKQFEEGNALITAEAEANFPVKMTDLIALSMKVAEHAPDLEICPDATIKSAIATIDRIKSTVSEIHRPRGDVGVSSPQASMHSTIGWAIKQMHNGARVRRVGWNGKGQWVGLVPGDQWGLGSGAPFDYGPGDLLPWLGIATAGGKFVPWAASQTDILATDWEIAN